MKSKRVNFAIALVMAIALWVFVFVGEDPMTTESIKSIPINFINEETLTAGNLVVLQKENTAINISLSGNRSAVSNTSPGDFRVTADIEGLKEGENTVRINVSGPQNVSIENYSPQKIKVYVDKLVTEDKPVNAVIINQNSDDSEPHIVQVSREKVKITGAKTLVDKVAYLKAEVDASKVGNTMKAFGTKLIPVDKEGNVAFGITPEKEKVSVTAVLHKTKTVNLIVPVTGNVDYFINRTINAPKTITIKGMEEDLALIDHIECEAVDVAHIYENGTVALTPILPENVEATMESENLRANVVVSGAATAEFVFDETAVVLESADIMYESIVAESLTTVKVSGNANVVAGITHNHFTLVADITGLGVGEHTVPLTVTCTNNSLELEYYPGEIKVIIEEPLADESQDAQAEESQDAQDEEGAI